MINKTHLATVLSLTLFSQLSNAAINIDGLNFEPVSHTDSRCEKTNDILENVVEIPFSQEDTIFTGTEFEVNRLEVATQIVNELQDLRNLLVSNGDSLLEDDAPLCIGAFGGDKSFNAFALNDIAILMGEELMVFLKEKFEDTSDQMTKFILFHEIAHSIQKKYNWQVIETNPLRKSKIQEMQADCMAAVFIDMQGQFNKLTPKAFENIAILTGDRTPYGDHGTSLQRFRAIVQGIKSYRQNIADASKMNSEYISSKMCTPDHMREILDTELPESE